MDFEGPKLPWVFGALSSLLSLSGPQMWIINSLPHLDCYFTPFSALIVLYLDCLGYFGSVSMGLKLVSLSHKTGHLYLKQNVMSFKDCAV